MEEQLFTLLFYDFTQTANPRNKFKIDFET